MKLMIIRHGDPDYENDTLTEKGVREARLLADRMEHVEAREYYVSVLGRARATAAPTLERVGREGIVCDWLKEFPAQIVKPHQPERLSRYCWDWLPSDWLADERLLREDQWLAQDAFAAQNVKAEYDYVISSFDALLKEHGYEREGRYYRAVKPNNDRLVFFCHFGLECVLLSHLMNVSPMILWHGLCCAPTGVSETVTEERRQGIASFRMSYFGDVSHLYMHGEPISRSARFRECWFNENERED